MVNWTFNASDYTARNFELIPEGDHRVRILDVTEKVYSTGNEGFQITLEVAGHNSRIWYNLILDPMEPQKTNQRIGMFFDSFGITNFDLNRYEAWIGLTGAVRVKHNNYDGKLTANVLLCLSRSQQDRLPKWERVTPATLEKDYFSEPVNTERPEVPKRSFDGFKF